MAIQFYCPSCQTLLSAANDKAGSFVPCPRCRGEMQVPEASPPRSLPVAHPPAAPAGKRSANDPFAFIKPEPLRDEKPQRGKPVPMTLLVFGVASLMFTLVVFILFYVPANDSHKADKPVNAAGPIVAQPSGIRSMPVVKAILGDAPSAEWEVVKRYVLRNSLNPDAIQFEKWFPSRDASPNDSNAFEVEKRYDPVVWNKLMEMNLQKRELEKPARYPGYFFGREDYLAQRAKLSEEERKEWDEYERKRDEFESTHKNLLSKQFVERKLMTADRVVRVITRTNAPILGTIRTDDFYYLKDGKVVKCQSGTPADQDKLIAIYYPGED